LNDAAVLSDKCVNRDGQHYLRAPFLQLLELLRVSFPCPVCRPEYTAMLDEVNPSEYINDGRAVEYVHWMHDRVNEKLQRTAMTLEITFERFELRTNVWSVFGSPAQTWDLCMMLALAPRETLESGGQTIDLADVFKKVVQTIRLLLWFCGQHADMRAPAMSHLSHVRLPMEAMDNQSIFDYVATLRIIAEARNVEAQQELKAEWLRRISQAITHD